MKLISSIVLLTFSLLQMNAQQLKTIAYKDGNQRLNGMITSNSGKKLPAVLILPAWKGIDNEAKTAALALEKEGYIAFIADIYGEGNIPADNTSAAKIAGSYKADYKAYQHRIELALTELKKQGADAERIAVIGYCFGGTGALEAARAGFPVTGVISIHGGLAKNSNRTNNSIQAKVLVEHPANDQSVSKADYDNFIMEMNQAKADWQIITYANSGHTFTNPESPDYNKIMADKNNLPKYAALQPHYNLVERDFETTYAPLAEKYGLSVFPYWSLAAGFLTGKYRTEEDFDKTSRGGGIKKYFNENGQAVLAALDTVSAKHNSEPATVALAWLLANPLITAPIVSATSNKQLQTIFDAPKLSLDQEDLELLNSIRQ